jgi:hypothetical protein
MEHLFEDRPFLRLTVLVVAASVLTMIALRGLRYGYVPMLIYHWRRKSDPFTYWTFMIFYCIGALGLWFLAAATLLRIWAP